MQGGGGKKPRDTLWDFIRNEYFPVIMRGLLSPFLHAFHIRPTICAFFYFASQRVYNTMAVSNTLWRFVNETLLIFFLGFCLFFFFFYGLKIYNLSIVQVPILLLGCQWRCQCRHRIGRWNGQEGEVVVMYLCGRRGGDCVCFSANLSPVKKRSWLIRMVRPLLPFAAKMIFWCIITNSFWHYLNMM